MEEAQRIFDTTKAAIERGDLPVPKWSEPYGRACLCNRCHDSCITRPARSTAPTASCWTVQGPPCH